MISLQEFLSYINLNLGMWQGSYPYTKDMQILYQDTVYICLEDHTSDALDFSIDASKWAEQPIYNQCRLSGISFVNSYCNREFSGGSLVDTFEGNGSDFYYLKNTPSAVSAVQYLDETNTFVTVFTGSETIANSLYIGSYIRLLNGVFECGKTYKVSYTGVDSVNDEVKQVALEVATLYYKNSPASEGRIGLTSVGMGSQATTSSSFSQATLEETYGVRLAKWRYWNV